MSNVRSDPTGSSKKIRERFFLDRFLQVAEISPSSIHERESPDFVLELDARAVGVEVTEVFHGASSRTPSLRAREGLEDRIVAAAKTIYEAARQRPVFVNVCFYATQDFGRVRRDSISAAIAGLVQRLIDNVDGPVHWRNDYSDFSLDAVAFVSAFPVSETSMGRWNVARAGWVAPLTVAELVPAVERKNARYGNYMQAVEEAWLLLSIDGNRPSQFFEIDDQLDLSSIGSRFDKTFFLRTYPPFLIGHARSARI